MVLIAAFVHYYGIAEMAFNRVSMGTCAQQLAAKWPEIYAVDTL
jgi:hypothetical protein